MGWAWSSGTQTLTWPLQEVMSRTSCSIGFLMRFTICAALIQSLLVGAALAGAQRPVVHWRNQRLSVESAGAPVVQILAEVARQTGPAYESRAPIRCADPLVPILGIFPWARASASFLPTLILRRHNGLTSNETVCGQNLCLFYAIQPR